MTIARVCTSLIAGVLLLAPLAAAQEGDSLEAVEITRDAEELQEMISHDVDHTNTAMLFTNTSRGIAPVICVGYNGKGQIVGRIRLKVPPHGLRFALASDLADDVDFIGSARCRTWDGVIGSAVLLRPGAVTDLPSQHLAPVGQLEAEEAPQPALRPEVTPDSASVDPASEPPDPRPIPLLRIRFPVVASY